MRAVIPVSLVRWGMNNTMSIGDDVESYTSFQNATAHHLSATHKEVRAVVKLFEEMRRGQKKLVEAIAKYGEEFCALESIESLEELKLRRDDLFEYVVRRTKGRRILLNSTVKEAFRAGWNRCLNKFANWPK